MLVLDRDGTLLPRADASLLDHASGEQSAPDTSPARPDGIVDRIVKLLSAPMHPAGVEAWPDHQITGAGSA